MHTWKTRSVLLMLCVLAALGGGAVFVRISDSSRDSSAPLPSERISQLLRVAVIGDGYTLGTSEDSGPYARWPYLVSQALGIDVQAAGSAGASFGGAPLSRFSAQTPKLASNARLVLLVGGVNDRTNSSAEIAAGARQAVARVKTQVPRAKVLLIGPVASPRLGAADLGKIRKRLKGIAKETRVGWLDPAAEGWVPRNRKFFGGDELFLNDQGQAVLAEKLQNLISKSLG